MPDEMPAREKIPQVQLYIARNSGKKKKGTQLRRAPFLKLKTNSLELFAHPHAKPSFDKGISLSRFPVAVNIALYSAGANGGKPGSPMPAGGASLATM